MREDIILQIKGAEKQANAKIQKSTNDAKEVLLKADLKIKELREQNVLEARQTAKEIIAKQVEKNKDFTAKKSEENSAICDEVIKKAKGKQSDAVSFVLEKVLGG